MAKFTHAGKTYDTKKRPKGMSEREFITSITGQTKDQVSSSSKSSKKSKSSKDSGSGDISDLVDKVSKEILGSTPGFQAPAEDFETKYTPELQAEDEAQSRALFEPYYNDQVSALLEDLSSTEAMESVSYDRTLRRARASLAQQGGAIGSEREMADKEITDRQTNERNTRLKTAERTIGTERLTGAGFQGVTGSPQEGSLIREMKGNIADQSLWYKNQRAQRYYGDAKTYYGTGTGRSLTGSKI